MATDELERRARRAYEKGRWLDGLVLAAPAGLVGILGVALSGGLARCVVLAVLLFGACAVLAWRGEAWGKAVVPGTLASLPAIGLPMLNDVLGHGCHASSCVAHCLIGCCGAGAIAGAIIYRGAKRLRAGHRRYLGGALLLAVLGGAMGCLVFGIAGIAALTLASVVVTLPLAWRAAPAR